MSVSSPFIHRPIATSLLGAAVLLGGLLGYFWLPVSSLPQVDFPTIQVSAGLPGANPETMAAAVATPLEKQFSTIAGLDALTSSSSQGNTQVTLQFNLSRDIDAAAQDVQAAISQVVRQLPQGMLPPSFRKVNPADSPILFMAVSSPTLYAAAELEAGAMLELPDSTPERGVYVAAGAIEIEGRRHEEGELVEFAPGPAACRAHTRSQLIIAGGDPLDGPRHIWWNFVSSSEARIEQAKQDWREQRFAPVPGDPERIPLPER